MAKEFAIKLYASKAWKQTRKAYISHVFGLCERCIKMNRYRAGYIVHHKIKLTPYNINKPEVTLNWDNLEYLCQECHNKVHGQDKATTVEGLEFDEEGNLIQQP